jgi:16S rRNA (adenine1518-N6/adenine1519-N6)-dimethyltransferase
MWREIHAAAIQNSALNLHPSTLLFSRLAFTVQWEVALRMSAPPGGRDYGPLGILLQALADVSLVRKIPPGAFWPPPKVHSALVVVTPRPERMARVPDAPAFQQLLAGLFAHRRQTLGNALKHHLAERWTPRLQEAFAPLDLRRRPETLSVAELLHVAALCAAPHP